MPIAETGMTVYWKDGARTAFNLLGDLQTARFPNTDEAVEIEAAPGQKVKVPGFFDWFGGNWATPPADGRPGVRQSLIVDSHSIQTVGVLLAKMREGDNEWGVPPGPITDLMMHAAAATRFPQGWAASDMRRKYLPGSVATDRPQPSGPHDPPISGAEARKLRQEIERVTREAGEYMAALTTAREKLAEAMATRDEAQKGQLTAVTKMHTLLRELEARAKGMKTAAGTSPRGVYQRALVKAAEGLEKTVAAYREKAGA